MTALLHRLSNQSIAKIVVDLALDREFDYRIPSRLSGAVQIGSRVAVQFDETVGSKDGDGAT